MTDSKYFTTTKKGEIYELKAELNSDKKEKKKEAVKKVIASMTVGKDVSSLFPDVVNCMQTDNLELKKLVYLYLMNYAKSQPDMAIMAVNTFVKDCEDPNPLIRALAVRTMGCIRVEKITEYLCEPLRKCLKDEDPYVRKTAAVCVAKLYDINSQLVEEQGFLDMLKDLISDSNPMVVANAVASLSEISESSENALIFKATTANNNNSSNMNSINKLLTALNECSEWGQVFILDSIANYIPKDEQEAKNICERVIPRLAHANAAVVLSTVKVLMKLIDLLENGSDLIIFIQKKLAPPLVTLLSAEAEIQYVALRNINLIVQKRPDILKNEMKVFFVKYNDPIYVKMEKLDIMIRLTNASNITQVLAELKEYATEVDVDFVRKSVRAIGRCAIKVEQAAEKCVHTLIDLIQTKVNYVVQEAIVVIKDIFRKYPNKYENIISTLCENLKSLDEPEARASMIWIIGEYAERIDNADELLNSFLDGFQDENSQVQLQLLTAIVKLFLKKPSETQDLVQNVLTLATQDTDNPDLRDRGYIYWRLLSTDAAAARDVVLAEKPLISEETDLLEPSLLDELICHISSLASVYHKPPNAFVEGKPGSRKHLAQTIKLTTQHDDEDEENEIIGGVSGQQSNTHTNNIKGTVNGANNIMDLLGLESDMNITSSISNTIVPPSSALASNNVTHSPANVLDLLGDDSFIGLSTQTPPQPQIPPQPVITSQSTSSSNLGGLFDIFGDLGINESTINNNQNQNQCSFIAPKQILITAQKGKGIEINGTFVRRAKCIYFELDFINKALQPMTNFAIQLNKNSFGLIPATPLQLQPSIVQPNQSVSTSLLLNTNGPMMKMQPLNNLQIAIKNNIDIFYFSTLVPMHCYFVEDGEIDKKLFLTSWKDIPQQNESQFQLPIRLFNSSDDLSHILKLNNIFTIAKRNVEGQDMLYQSIKLINGIWILAEVKSTPNTPNITVSF
jgi:vesicle coat complex subunit